MAMLPHAANSIIGLSHGVESLLRHVTHHVLRFGSKHVAQAAFKSALNLRRKFLLICIPKPMQQGL
jgi:hypothetical protein